MATPIRNNASIDLFTKTSIIKRNYYALYVDNPQVSCILRLWNQMIFFLFNRCNSFLGAAADQKGTISVRQEFTLINRYNETKKKLYEALIAFEHDPTEWENAKTQYTKAVDERITQLSQTFGFSNEVEHQELDVNEEELKDAINRELDQMVGQSQISASLTDALKFRFTSSPPAREELKQQEGKTEENLKHEELTQARKALKDQLEKTSDLSTVDNLLWDNYKKALESVTAKNGSSDFAPFYKELQSMVEAMDQYHDKQTQLKIMQQLAVALELPQNDPQFLYNYLSAIRSHYITFEFGRLQILDTQGDKALLLLKDYAEAAKNAYHLKPLNTKKTDPVSFAKSHLLLLLSELAKCENLKSETEWISSLREIVENLAHFKDGMRNDQAIAFANRFANDPSSSSQSTSASVSSSTSSSMEKPASDDEQFERARKALEEPLNPSLSTKSSSSSSSSASISASLSDKENTSNKYFKAQTELVTAFIKEEDAAKIPKQIISRFLTAAKKHAEKNPKLGLLNFIRKDVFPVENSALFHLEKSILQQCVKTPEILFQILTLKVKLARKWKLCTPIFLKEEIHKLIFTFEFHKALTPAEIVEGASKQPKTPLLLCTFYNKIKELYKSFNNSGIEEEATKLARSKLFLLCTVLWARYKELFATFINSFDETSADEPRKLAFTISQAILNFKITAGKAQRASRESFLSLIIKMSADSPSLPIAQ